MDRMMANAMRAAFYGSAGGFLMIVSGITVAVVAPIFGPDIEASISPVLSDTWATSIQRDAAGVGYVYIWIDKERPHCRYTEQRFLVNGRDVLFDRPWTVINPAPRPSGRQAIGWYRFQTSKAPPGAVITGAISYRCHPFWSTTYTFGPWTLPSAEGPAPDPKTGPSLPHE